MEREIKFRAWDNESETMAYSNKQDETGFFFIGDDGIHFGFVDEETDDTGYIYPVTKEPEQIIMQFTGLKDKNGKEIYEGDILCFSRHENTKHQTRWVMEWNNEQCRYTDYSPKGDAEVIGNIHENPELLK